MKFVKCKKGSYKYINTQRINEIIRTVFMFACAIGLYLIGYLTLKTNKNFWTIFAVLSVLPAAKSAVSMIMFLRFSSINQDEYSLIEKNKGRIPTVYELVFTTTEKSYYVKSAACCDATVVMFYDTKGKKDLSKELKKHINSAIEREGMSGYSVKIYTYLDDYVKRLDEMNTNLNGAEDTSSKRIFALFEAITI